jgi:hypothetical protein
MNQYKVGFLVLFVKINAYRDAENVHHLLENGAEFLTCFKRLVMFSWASVGNSLLKNVFQFLGASRAARINSFFEKVPQKEV